MKTFDKWWEEHIFNEDCPLMKINWTLNEVAILKESMKIAYEHKEEEEE